MGLQIVTHATVAYSCFRQRFDIENIFRFSKQRLLMTQFQTPSVEHEENWIRLVMLSYVQLWAARELAKHLPRAWERYLKQNNDKIVTPSVVRCDLQRIISQIGEPVAVVRQSDIGGFPKEELPWMVPQHKQTGDSAAVARTRASPEGYTRSFPQNL